MEEMNYEEKSPLEIAAEFMEAYPQHADAITPENFTTFFQKPKEVIELFNATKEFLITTAQLPEELIDEELPHYLNLACEDVNLNSNDE